jgi:hypothetical protein
MEFWRRRFAAFNRGSRQSEARPKLPARIELPVETPAAETASRRARRPSRAKRTEVAGTEVARSTRRPQQEKVEAVHLGGEVSRTDEMGRLTAEDINSLAELGDLLFRDFLQLALSLRQSLWDRILNRHLYPKPAPSNYLLASSVMLFLFGSFWGGLAVLMVAFRWRERPDG